MPRSGSSQSRSEATTASLWQLSAELLRDAVTAVSRATVAAVRGNLALDRARAFLLATVGAIARGAAYLPQPPSLGGDASGAWQQADGGAWQADGEVATLLLRFSPGQEFEALADAVREPAVSRVVSSAFRTLLSARREQWLKRRASDDPWTLALPER